MGEKGNKVAVAPKQSCPWFRKKAVQPNFIVILLENVYFFIYAVNYNKNQSLIFSN